MATAEQLWSGMMSQINGALETNGLNAKVGIDWPPKDALDLVSQSNSSPVISIFDCGGIKKQTRNTLLIPVQPLNYGTPGSTLVANQTVIGSGGTVVLSGANSTLTFDCFFLALDLLNSTFFVNYIATISITQLIRLQAL